MIYVYMYMCLWCLWCWCFWTVAGHGGRGDLGGPGDTSKVRAHHAAQAPGSAAVAAVAAVAGAEVAATAAPRGGATATEEQCGSCGRPSMMPWSMKSPWNLHEISMKSPWNAKDFLISGSFWVKCVISWDFTRFWKDEIGVKRDRLDNETISNRYSKINYKKRGIPRIRWAKTTKTTCQP